MYQKVVIVKQSNDKWACFISGRLKRGIYNNIRKYGLVSEVISMVCILWLSLVTIYVNTFVHNKRNYPIIHIYYSDIRIYI